VRQTLIVFTMMKQNVVTLSLCCALAALAAGAPYASDAPAALAAPLAAAPRDPCREVALGLGAFPRGSTPFRLRPLRTARDLTRYSALDDSAEFSRDGYVEGCKREVALTPFFGTARGIVVETSVFATEAGARTAYESIADLRGWGSPAPRVVRVDAFGAPSVAFTFLDTLHGETNTYVLALNANVMTTVAAYARSTRPTASTQTEHDALTLAPAAVGHVRHLRRAGVFPPPQPAPAALLYAHNVPLTVSLDRVVATHSLGGATAHGVYIVVVVRVRNTGAAPAPSGLSLALQDDRGRVYAQATGAAAGDATRRNATPNGYPRATLQPLAVAHAAVVFDVDPAAVGLRLRTGTTASARDLFPLGR